MSKYFSSNYEEAREKFLRSCHNADASIESFKNPYPGPKGDMLFTDVALIGPNHANNILVLGSGTHGVEGFAGSAIQTGLLEEGIAMDLKNDMSILLIHAINPYGFASLRRWNEDNVDLNRNFLDHSKPYPRNSGYEQLADTINPKSISLWENVKSCFRIAWFGLKHGRRKLKEAISGGQYTHPQGIFFGGTSETWSNKIIREIASRYLSHTKRVVVVDIHTGLGPCGNAEIILNENEQSSAYKRSVEWWGDKVKTTVSGESVSVHLQESLKLDLPRILPNTEVTAVSLEFGTISALKVFWALRAENWLYHYGGEKYPGARRIKDELLRAFYPDSDKWKTQVWKQGKGIVEQALVHI